MSYILFYSNYCKYSKKFINILEKTGEATFFVKISVEKDPKTNQRPQILNKYGVIEVPTIIVENKKLAGYSAFKWLHSRIENSQDQVNSLSSRQNKQTIDMQQLNQQKQENTIEPFYTGTTVNLTDNCVQLGDTDTQQIYTPSQDEEVSRENNFKLQDDNLTSVAINTNVDLSNNDDYLPTKSITKDKLKSKQIENEYSKLIQERDTMIPKPVPRI